MLKLIVAIALIIGVNSNPIITNTNTTTSDSLSKSNFNDEATFRLPNNSIPVKYEVKLTTKLHQNEFKFHGRVTIEIEIQETSNFITIHSKQQKILSTKILNDDGGEFEIVATERDEMREFITFRVKGYFYRREKVFLMIDYESDLREDNRGFYRSYYMDENGETKWLASTQFSAADARHAFPCYDEPQIRAIFSIQITAHKSFDPISNMPVKSTETGENEMVTTTFEDTPIMQTYILAFVISEFDFIENNQAGVPQRVYGRSEAIKNNQGTFALEAGLKVMDYMQKYFEMEYYLPKMYQVAIPDFFFNAMENWGLITYREASILYDEEKPSLMAKRDISRVMCHEFAHNYFGNLVAPKYWYYVWGKEGFATLYEYEFLANLYPEYQDRDQMVSNAVQYSLLRDATEETRPLTTFVKEPNEIYATSSTFVIYQKGGSILRMFQHAIGEETFKKGVKDYLQTRQFKAADTTDLARALENAARIDEKLPKDISFKDIIDSWSLKSGYPLVTVTFDMQRDKLKLSQTKFQYAGGAALDDDLWLIPITIAESTSQSDEIPVPTWMKTKDLEINQNLQADNDWIIINVQEMGYFRVNYDENLWKRLIEVLKSDAWQEIHRINRAQLIDDALNVARTSHLSYNLALHVLEYLPKEDEFLPWVSTSTALEYIYRLLGDSEIFQEFNDFINDLVTPLFTSMGTEDQGMSEVLPEKIKRQISIKWACLTGSENCIRETKEKVEDALENPSNEPSGDIRFAIYCNGLRSADEVLHKKVWEKMLAEKKDQGYRRTLIQSLGCTVDQSIQEDLLSSTLDERNSGYRQQEKLDVVIGILNNGGKNGLAAVMAFLKENSSQIEEGFVGIKNPVKTVVTSMAEFIVSDDLFKDYFELHQAIASLLTKEETFRNLNAAQLNLIWLKDNQKDIKEFLDEYNQQKKRKNMNEKEGKEDEEAIEVKLIKK